MRVEFDPAPTFRLVGSFDEISDFLTRLVDGGFLFDYAVQGWTADPSGAGHIEAKAALTISPDDTTQAAMIRLMLP